MVVVIAVVAAAAIVVVVVAVAVVVVIVVVAVQADVVLVVRGNPYPPLELTRGEGGVRSSIVKIVQVGDGMAKRTVACLGGAGRE